MDPLIAIERCRYCLTPIVFNPFVAQWTTIPSSVCTANPETWKTHELLITYSPWRIREVIRELVLASSS